MLTRFLMAAAILLALAACGGPEPSRPHEGSMVISNESIRPWAQTDDFRARFDAQVDAGLRYWGGTEQDIAGLHIRVVDTDPCNNPAAGGCFSADRWEIQVGTLDAAYYRCVEMVPVAHELGHAVLLAQTGDPDGDHSDPRWPGMNDFYLDTRGVGCP